MTVWGPAPFAPERGLRADPHGPGDKAGPGPGVVPRGPGFV